MADLTTTNVFLGIMAFVSLLEAMAVIGIFVAGALIVRRLIQVLNAIEARQVAPAVARVNGILDDVKEVTSAVKADTEQLDRAIHRAADVMTQWRAGARRTQLVK
jgi:pyrimidine operon attenuation protein/uracil phosphoribosyltransferase